MSNENPLPNPLGPLIFNLSAMVEIEKRILVEDSIGNASIREAIINLKEIILYGNNSELINSHPNPLNRCGKKCFSQNEEDGITLEIIRRLKIEKGCFAEFGVGNGLENNTLVLAGLGWKGFWAGGEDLAFNFAKSNKFVYLKEWLTLENVSTITKNALAQLGVSNPDVISLDLDGNDIYFVRNLLENNYSPKLFIVEYNAKFLPPVRFQIKYNPEHQWDGSDYFGASLTSYDELFSEFGYQLVCCNALTGSNAFFVKKEHLEFFEDVPNDIKDIYVGPRYHLYQKFGHKMSPQVVEVIFNNLTDNN